MTEKKEIDASQELMDLLFTALDHGIESVRASGQTLTPFNIMNITGQKVIHRFVTERLELSVEKAKDEIREKGKTILMYVVAYDGYVTQNGKKYSAVFVHAGEKGKEKGVIMAQRYKQGKTKGVFETIGNPMYLGAVENLLAT